MHLFQAEQTAVADSLYADQGRIATGKGGRSGTVRSTPAINDCSGQSHFHNAGLAVDMKA